MRLLTFLSIAGFLLRAAAQENIAVLELDADGVEASEARTLTNKLRGELVTTGKFSVIERGKMEEILHEQGFQQTGCTTQECAVQVGQLIGVRKIVAGSAGRVGKTFLLSLRLVDVGTGKVEKSAEETVKGEIDQLLTAGVRNAARKLAGLTADATPSSSEVVAAPTSDPGAAQVFFAKFYPEEMILDHATKLYLGGKPDDGVRECLIGIAPGHHVIHYDVSALVRYYAEVDVKPGKNYLEPKYVYLGLPEVELRVSADDSIPTLTQKKAFPYFTYVKNVRVSHTVAFDVTVEAKKAKNGKAKFEGQWKIALDGKTISKDKVTDENPLTVNEVRRKEATVLYDDGFHYYYYSYYVSAGTIDLTLGSYFSEYKK